MARKKKGGTSTPREEGDRAAVHNISDYEKVRLDRIQRNKAKLAELGLDSGSIACQLPKQEEQKVQSVAGGSALRRSTRLQGKGKSVQVEQQPADDQNASDEEMIISREAGSDNEDNYVPPGIEESESDPDDVDEENTSEYEVLAFSKEQRKMSTSPSNTSELQEDETDLQQAIALSLQQVSQPPRKSTQKRKTTGKATFYLSAAEVDALYYAIVGAGRGISMRELQQVADTHNFTWSKYELQEMISLFDSDMDGMLSLVEFQKMSARCHVLKD